MTMSARGRFSSATHYALYAARTSQGVDISLSGNPNRGRFSRLLLCAFRISHTSHHQPFYRLRYFDERLGVSSGRTTTSNRVRQWPPAVTPHERKGRAALKVVVQWPKGAKTPLNARDSVCGRTSNFATEIFSMPEMGRRPEQIYCITSDAK